MRLDYADRTQLLHCPSNSPLGSYYKHGGIWYKPYNYQSTG